MLEELVLLFRQKIKAVEEKYLEHFVAQVKPGSIETILLRPGNELLLRNYVKGHFRHEILADCLKEVISEKQTEMDEYFKHIDDVLNYYGAIHTDPKLGDFLIEAHRENADLFAGMKLSKEHQDFLKLGKALHDQASVFQQGLDNAMKALCEPAAFEVADLLLKSPSYDAAVKRVRAKIARSTDSTAMLCRMTEVLLNDFQGRFESFYDVKASHVARRNALDRVIEDIDAKSPSSVPKDQLSSLEAMVEENDMKKQYSQNYLKMKIIVDVLWLKYEQAAVDHLKELASHVVGSSHLAEARLKVVEKSYQAFYYHHNGMIAQKALSEHYSHSFNAYYSADHDSQTALLGELASHATHSHYGKVSHTSEGFFEMLFAHQQTKPRVVANLTDLDHHDEHTDKKQKNPSCTLQ